MIQRLRRIWRAGALARAGRALDDERYLLGVMVRNAPETFIHQRADLEASVAHLRAALWLALAGKSDGPPELRGPIYGE